ncbi:MAG: tRNA (5-methylaminomethyl-2-thiouridine)(34)-methyltransferase MnmD [Dysgonamonadaceae bacterium]|nr:tRNA (5-methylaminomethyl-2-thiouridine)(34)-methyltransferase MnmD [Dysgonamonadaceae bacterium]
MPLQIKQTADGSPTLYLPERNESYHSMNGAVQESLHVYIQAGFNHCRKDRIHVLEMGFGTGLNAFLTALEAKKRRVEVTYTALEKYPLPAGIVRQLRYSDREDDLFRRLHDAAWERPVPLTPAFTLHKIKTDFAGYDYSGGYDVVYYDAFAPDKQPEAWSPALFEALYAAMLPGGILTTYCAKGAVRRMMRQAGFAVERIPGPPGKREMLRAEAQPLL